MKIIRKLCRTQFFKMILREWSLHVKTDQNPTMFANMYLEWMRDPVDHEGRQATVMFLSFIKPREWSQVMEALEPNLESDVAAVFRTAGAEEFYNGWKTMVVHEVQAYWEAFLAFRKEERGADEPGPRDWSPRTEICKCGKLPWKCSCKRSK